MSNPTVDDEGRVYLDGVHIANINTWGPITADMIRDIREPLPTEGERIRARLNQRLNQRLKEEA